MNTAAARLILVFLIAGIAAVSMTACSQSPQEKYQHAQTQLQQARKDRDQAREKVEETRKKLAHRQKKLNAAEDKLQATKQDVQKAAQAVDRTVNDAMLFRTLQGQLVDKDDFGTSAISVAVQNRIVTLSGTVPNKKTHQRALKIAHSQAGVKQVVDRLQITPAANTRSGDSGNTSPDHT